MARAGSTAFAAIALLLIGGAAEANDAAADRSAGVSVSGTAAAVASPPVELVARPNRWGIAGKPRYESGGWWCSPGLVWRNAGPRDWLCVDQDEALRIDRENEAAAENWVDGAYTCRSGLVRREAFTRDVVCVEPERRDAVRLMNTALYTVK